MLNHTFERSWFSIPCFFLLITFLFSTTTFSQFSSVTNLNSISVTTDNTSEKPQSKIWSYAGKSWSVLANSSGTHVFRLDGTNWTNILTISTNSQSKADCKVVGDKVYALLFQGSLSELKTLQYASNSYTLTSTVPITLDSGVEIATLDMDSNGRLWIASDIVTEIVVRWSDSPYTTWSSPITIATGINSDDISTIISFDNKIGILWSNQNTRRFGFKTHIDGTNVTTWSADEVPASQSALNVGLGMADDHLNVVAGTDGTLYCAVKTSYDVAGYTKIALLIRRPTGVWDDLYEVDQTGTRAIILLNESINKLKIVYTSSEGYNDIVYKESSISNISFSPRLTLITGGYNNVTSVKNIYTNTVVILASNSNSAIGIIGSDSAPGSLVGHWAMEETTGATVLVDSSLFGNNATVTGSLTRETGSRGYSQNFAGTTNYALVPDNSNLDITNTITLAAWIKPGANTTQDVLNKKTNGSVNGYELTLSSSTAAVVQKIFVRFNQQTSADTYRVNSTTTYPIDGSWIHAAATYDGATIKLYINGVLESSMPAAITIAANNLPVGLGAQSDGAREFTGSIDDARIYNTALTLEEIQELITTWTPPPGPGPQYENNGAGYALNFDFVNDYVDCGNNPSVQITQSITMEAWVKSNLIATQSILKKNTGSSGYEISLSASSTNPQNVFVRFNGTDTYRLNSTSLYPVNGQWIHVAATYDYATKQMKLYVNGILESESMSGPTSIASNTNNLVIGTDAVTPRSKYFNGSLDEIRLWNVVRTQAEIQENMCKKLTGTESGLAGYWNFNEKSGTTIKDLTVNANNGTLMNSDNDEHLFSGAAIGDASIFDYNSAGGFTATLSHPDGDAITATTTSGTITGLQIYRVDDNPLRTNSTTPPDVTLSQFRYWGVKAIGSNTPTYTVSYNYSGHPGITEPNEILLDLALRDNLADDSWINMISDINTTTNTLTLNGMTGTEYTLATLSDDPLPVELSSFTAKLINKTVLLNWSTSTEVNNYGFEVERNSGDTWTNIGFVIGNGNSNSPKDYSFTDKNITNANLQYRLKQIDIDGSATYSSIVEVALVPDEFTLSQNYPNPFNPSTKIKYSLPIAAQVNIRLYDILGNELKTLVSSKQEAGNYEVVFDAGNLASGTYFYTMQAGEFTKVNKMILLK